MTVKHNSNIVVIFSKTYIKQSQSVNFKYSKTCEITFRPKYQATLHLRKELKNSNHLNLQVFIYFMWVGPYFSTV